MLSAFLSLLLFFIPVAHAQTSDTIQAQIDQSNAQISKLQKEIEQLTGELNATSQQKQTLQTVLPLKPAWKEKILLALYAKYFLMKPLLFLLICRSSHTKGSLYPTYPTIIPSHHFPQRMCTAFHPPAKTIAI